MNTHIRKPDWIINKLKETNKSRLTKQIVAHEHLHTVCTQARCPNKNECFSKGIATFLLMGKICTRNCLFCNIASGKPLALNPDEPEHIAQAVFKMKINHCVLTSVTRDDLPDYGISHYIQAITEIKKDNPHTTVEVLTPDFNYLSEYYLQLCNADIRIYNHNIETVESLFPVIRDKRYSYQRSLEMLLTIKEHNPSLITKSGFMIGLGENKNEVHRTLDDLVSARVSIVTIGQYIPPSKKHYPVAEYLHPYIFDEYCDYGQAAGIQYVFSSPLVRSSYSAEEAMKNVIT